MRTTWATAADGTRLAVHHIEGDGTLVVGVHATGFCGPVLGPLARRDPAGAPWALPDLRAHGLSGAPPLDELRWADLATDVLAVVEAGGSSRPSRVVGFGHSAGGAALALAEARRPGTFAALYLYEPVLWPDLAAARPRAARLAEGARRRRATFADRPTARARFAARQPLARFHPEALDAYLAGGFEPGEDGRIRLRCRPEAEAALYEQGAVEDSFRCLAAVACPVTVAAGGRSLVALARAQVAALPGGRLEVHDELGHFGPMVAPGVVAEAFRAAVGSA